MATFAFRSPVLGSRRRMRRTIYRGYDMRASAGQALNTLWVVEVEVLVCPARGRGRGTYGLPGFHKTQWSAEMEGLRVFRETVDRHLAKKGEREFEPIEEEVWCGIMRET